MQRPRLLISGTGAAATSTFGGLRGGIVNPPHSSPQAKSPLPTATSSEGCRNVHRAGQPSQHSFRGARPVAHHGYRGASRDRTLPANHLETRAVSECVWVVGALDGGAVGVVAIGAVAALITLWLWIQLLR
jgi:hypothetical protein